MIDALFSGTDYVAAKQMLDATVLRQEAIASNLANLDTPNYKRLDVAPNFQAQLSQAIASKDSAKISSLQPQLSVDTSAVSGRADGNTVSLENEMLQLSQNMLEHSVETQLVSTELSRMQMAITGKS